MRAFCLFDATVMNHRLIETPHGRHTTESGRYPTAEVTRSRLTISAMCRGSKQPRHMVDLVLWYHSVASRKKLSAMPAPRPMWASALSLCSIRFWECSQSGKCTLTWAAQVAATRGSNSSCIVSCSWVHRVLFEFVDYPDEVTFTAVCAFDWKTSCCRCFYGPVILRKKCAAYFYLWWSMSKRPANWHMSF